MSEIATPPAHPVVDEPLRAGLTEVDAGVVEVTGGDRADYLHNVLSQVVLGLESGEVRGALHLDQHGAPLAVLDLVVLEDRILLVTPAAELAAAVAEDLGSRTFLADARFETLGHTVVVLRGDEAAEVAKAAGHAVPGGRARPTVDGDGVVVGRDDGIDIIGSPVAVEAIAGALLSAGAARVDRGTVEAWRIARGVPAWGREIRRPHLPEEAGVLPTHVHLDKGCYPGQEAVARMWMLGRPRRRLARVRLAEGAGAGFTAGRGRQQVEVTSSASYAGERIGLAYVPASTEPGDELADGRVVVRDLVGVGPVPGAGEGVVRRRDRRDDPA